jgi:hypothetical protein
MTNQATFSAASSAMPQGLENSGVSTPEVNSFVAPQTYATPSKWKRGKERPATIAA